MKPILSILLCLILTSSANGQKVTSIFFNISSSELTKKSTQTLDSLVYHNIIKPNKKYSIVGYADNTGGDSSNNELSTQRAIAVFKQLQYLSIDTQNIKTLIGKGAVGVKNISNQNNRRVDIIIDTGKINNQKPILVDIKKIKPGEKFKLDKLFFVGGMATLLPTSMPVLESLLQVMKNNPKLKIRLEGHVHHQNLKYRSPNNAVSFRNSRSLDVEMQKLSEDRALAVYKYLVDNDINKERVKWKGFSYSKFHESPNNNRRVEVRILAK